jgi:hypothetical protein
LSSCTQTDQWAKHGLSDWQTLVELFKDDQTPARWTITTPADRGGVVAGPHVYPLFNWSEPAFLTDANTGVCPSPPTFRAVLKTGGIFDLFNRPLVGAETLLQKPLPFPPRLIVQGETDANGEIILLGASQGDIVTFITTVEGFGLSGPYTASVARSFAVTCPTQRAAAVGPVIEVELEEVAFALNVSTSPGDAADDVQITVTADMLLNAPPTVTLNQATAAPQPVIMQFDSETESYHGQAMLNSELGTAATIAASASDTQGNRVETFAAFEMTVLAGDEETTVLSADGRAELLVPAGALPAGGRISIETSQLPGPLPVGLVTLGDPYTLRAASSLTLSNPADLILYYLDIGGTLRQADLSTAQIYRWTGNEWSELEGTGGRDSILAAINDFGTYVLLYEVDYHLYLLV